MWLVFSNELLKWLLVLQLLIQNLLATGSHTIEVPQMSKWKIMSIKYVSNFHNSMEADYSSVYLN